MGDRGIDGPPPVPRWPAEVDARVRQPSRASRFERFADAVRKDRQPAKPYSGGMVDRVEDGGRGRNQRRLADPFRAVGSERFGVLDQQAFDLGHVADGGEQVVVQVLGAPRHVLFHQGEPDALCDSALDLPLHQSRVDRGADVVRGDDASRHHGAKLQVHLHARDLRGEAVGRVRDSLAVLVEGGGGRIEVPPTLQHDVATPHDRQAPERDDVLHAATVGDAKLVPVEPDCGVGPGIDERQHLRPQVRACELGRAAGHEGLARGRRLSRILGEVGVRDHHVDPLDGQAQGLGHNLQHDRRRALPDVLRPVAKQHPSITGQGDPHRGGVRHRGVAAAVPHAGDPGTAPPIPSRARGVEGIGLLAKRRPARAQRIQACDQPHARLQHLAGRGAISGPQGVAAPEIERIETRGRRQLVHQRLVRDGGLRHPEAAKGAGRRGVREDRARFRPYVRHAVGAHAVHRDPAGHGRAPRRVGAGVEIAIELVSDESAAGAGHRTGADARRVPLGGGGHRFRTRPGAAHRHSEHPRGERYQRLDGLIQLSAEASSARRRPDAHAVGRDAEHVRHFVPIHVWRLGAGRDLDAAALDAPCVPRLRLDVGMLDERCFELAARLQQPVPAPPRHLPGAYPAAGEHVVGVRRLDGRGLGRHRFARVVDRRKRLPLDGKLIIGEPVEGDGFAHQCGHRLAAVARHAGRKHRLVLDVGVDPEAVDARDVGGGEDPGESGMPRVQRGAVADREAGVGVGGAHHP